MLLEITRLTVPAEQAGAFETAFHTAQHALGRCPGYLTHELQRHVAEPGHYALLVEWQAPPAPDVSTLWRTALQPFCAQAPDSHLYHLVAGRGVQPPAQQLRYPD